MEATEDAFKLKFLLKNAIFRNKDTSEICFLEIKEIFLNHLDGLLHFSGKDQIKRNISVHGLLTEDFTFLCRKKIEGVESEPYIITLNINEKGIFLTSNEPDGFMELIADLDICKGQFKNFGKFYDMEIALKFDGLSIKGISKDFVGIAVWKGSKNESEISMTKKYLKKHFVLYKGKVEEKDNEIDISGKWEIEGFFDDFNIKIPVKKED